MTSLPSRLKTGSGADRKLDRELWLLFNPEVSAPEERYFRFPFPELTSSLDAVFALVEWELPGCQWLIRRLPSLSNYAAHIKPLKVEKEPHFGEGSSPCRALLLALLDAKAGKETE